RGGGGARRFHPGADPEPFYEAAAGAGPHLPVHLARPRRGGAPVGPGGDHVSGPRGGGGAGRRGVPPRQPPLHAGAAVRGAAHRNAQAGLRGGEGRDTLAAEPAARLPLPPALPARLRPLPRGAAGAEAGGGGPHQRVPPERQGL
ncbi:MAG: ABC transporter, ATP-binding protein (cluster 5, nickel/peptides/opines), partial [uncultured Acetobacteraceae bacterium]